VLLAVVLGLTSCGQQTSRSVAGDVSGSVRGDTATQDPQVVRLAQRDERPRLTCTTDERSLMIADFAVGARGAATPEEAVGLTSLKPGERMVVSPTGSRVWILRADGTAREAIHLTRLRGWLLHMRESCA